MHRSIIASLLLAFGLALGNEARAEPPDYPVEIAPGLAPQMTPHDVAQVLAHSRVSRILSMECVRGDPWKTTRQDNPAETFGPDVVWVVRAKGAFVSRRSWPGKGPIVRSSGFYVLDDETGQIIARGTLPRPEPEGD